MRRSEEFIDLQSIPTDSRRRDCLVMYCGIADLTTRQQIAAYCLSIIAGASDQIASGQILEARAAIHAAVSWLKHSGRTKRQWLASASHWVQW